MKPYLKDIINDLEKFETWKIQLKITINFISSKDDNESLNKRYQSKLKEVMKSSEFVFDYVHLLCYKPRGGTYIDSPDWIKNKKSNNKSYQ